jgi:hypothetical protein
MLLRLLLLSQLSPTAKESIILFISTSFVLFIYFYFYFVDISCLSCEAEYFRLFGFIIVEKIGWQPPLLKNPMQIFRLGFEVSL